MENRIYTITQTASLLELSRPRFYELLKKGVFPKPLRNPDNHRPYYDQTLYEKCKKIRQSGIDANGRVVNFYTPRRQDSAQANIDDNKYGELYNIIKNMGISCTQKRIDSTLKNLFPDGFEGMQKGLVIRKLFRQLCKDAV